MLYRRHRDLHAMGADADVHAEVHQTEHLVG